MTILTKPFSEKKAEKLVVPLVENEQLPIPTTPDDVEAQSHPRIIIFPAKAHRVSLAVSSTLCLLIAALAVVGIGVIGGKYLYDEYLSVSRHMTTARLEGSIPMDNDLEESSTFKESFEINNYLDYEKIDVPDFRDGRSGRFIHDFNTNVTGIIDITERRCFVMPLNRVNVLPPKSLFDLIQKMWEGYYKVDTDVVRKTMRVVIPPITDTSSIGTYISSECENFPIYKLEKYVGGVVKRSVDLQPQAKFAQFAGKGITEFDIVNMDEVVAYERHLNL